LSLAKSSTREVLGPRLLQARQAAALSLAQVAAATGVSASFISAVEKGKSDISISRLMLLVRCYRISVTELLEEGRENPLHVVKARNRRELALESERISVFLLASDGEHAMMPVLNEYAVSGHMDEAVAHEGEEFVFVLEGTVELQIEGEPPVILDEGDSAYYRADVPHAFRNIADVPARFLGVASPPNF
jgi:transcriptional regulator with XRE-family HTH domain